MKHLQSSRRVVPLDQLDEYMERWSALRTQAEEAHGHAWLFRDVRRQDHFMEFVEFGTAEVLESIPGVPGARRDIDEFFGHAAVDEWEEAPEGEPDV